MDSETLLFLALFIIAILIIACCVICKFFYATYYFDEFTSEIEMNNRNEHGNRGTDRRNIGQEVNAETQV